MKSLCVRLIKYAWFLVIVNGHQFTSFTDALLKIGACGFSPKGVLDVGANTGDWSKAIKEHYPQSDFFLVEGNSDHIASLKSTGLNFVISLVGDKDGSVKFYKGKEHMANTGNSIFKESTKYFKDSEAIELPLTTIDKLVKSAEKGPFQLMKIDIQGAEVAAIKGAPETLRNVEVLFTEVSIVEYNRGSPSFLELHTLLDSFDFAIFDITDQARYPGNWGGNKGAIPNMLVQVDVMWVKKSSLLWDENCTGFAPPIHFKKIQLGIPTPLQDKLQLFGYASEINHAVCVTMETAALAGWTFQLVGPSLDTPTLPLISSADKKQAKLYVLRSIVTSLPPDTFVVFSDTFDMSFQTSMEYFSSRMSTLHKTKAAEGKIIYGTESNCWPFKRVSDDFYCPLMQGEEYLQAHKGEYVAGVNSDQDSDPRPLGCHKQIEAAPHGANRFIYLNSGISVGSALSYRTFLDILFTVWDELPDTCREDQGAVAWVMVNSSASTTSGGPPIVLDYELALFLNHYESHLAFDQSQGAWVLDAATLKDFNYFPLSPVIHHAGDKSDHTRFRDALFRHAFLGNHLKRDAFFKNATIYVDGVEKNLYATCKAHLHPKDVS